jgi:hypothetical protein
MVFSRYSPTFLQEDQPELAGIASGLGLHAGQLVTLLLSPTFFTLKLNSENRSKLGMEVRDLR